VEILPASRRKAEAPTPTVGTRRCDGCGADFRPARPLIAGNFSEPVTTSLIGEPAVTRRWPVSAAQAVDVIAFHFDSAVAEVCSYLA
jgi:hypothetical protein